MQVLDVFVLPSKNEGISNTILEALASGLPVIATAVGGNVELVEEGVNGMLVQPGDVAGMAQALLGYLDAPARIAEHGETCAAAGRAALQHSGHGRGLCRGIRPDAGTPALRRRQAARKLDRNRDYKQYVRHHRHFRYPRRATRFHASCCIA